MGEQKPEGQAVMASGSVQVEGGSRWAARQERVSQAEGAGG